MKHIRTPGTESFVVFAEERAKRCVSRMLGGRVKGLQASDVIKSVCGCSAKPTGHLPPFGLALFTARSPNRSTAIQLHGRYQQYLPCAPSASLRPHPLFSLILLAFHSSLSEEDRGAVSDSAPGPVHVIATGSQNLLLREAHPTGCYTLSRPLSL